MTEVPSGDPAATRREVEDRPDRSDLWQEYTYLGELYKFYLDLTVKAATAYFAIVSAILTLVLTNVRSEHVVDAALIAPITLSVLLALVTRRTAR